MSLSLSDSIGDTTDLGMPSSDAGVAIGVDLGGTSLRVGFVDAGGQVLHTRIVPSTTGLQPMANMTYLGDVIEGVIAEMGVDRVLWRGIGIGTSGPVDTVTGLIDNPHTLPGWSGVALRQPLSERFGVPVLIDNDASAAALGEYWQGAGVGSQRMVMVTIGTGIGGALIIDGYVYEGARGFHPEMGHQVIDPSGPACYCGAIGCWEQLVAGPAIARDWAEVLARRSEKSDQQASAENMFAAARAGDLDALALVTRISHYLGIGLQNIVAFLAPDIVVIGGGVAEHFDLLETGMHTALRHIAGHQPYGGTRVLAARLGNAAGVLGAAYLIVRHGHSSGGESVARTDGTP